MEKDRHELHKTLHNLAEVAMVLDGIPREDLLPTIEETLFEQAQKLVMNYDTLEEKVDDRVA
uniref:Uncharacterized protein n=1 Tax=viral metagenome TaxID=1070528 RepID=A0A6M3JI93_9ZZZZ